MLVGGVKREGGVCKMLSVWEAEHKAWTYPYPEMPTARSQCSVVVYKEWLVVAGGRAGGICLSCVEVLNTVSKQWHTGPPTPTPWSRMKTAIIRDMAYFMGGYISTGPVTRTVYCICIPTLISHITQKTSGETEGQIWKEITGLQLTRSTPLSLNGLLLAVGGQDNDNQAVTAIHLYQPDREEWMKVGDLPLPCYQCTCAMITDKLMLVAGGQLQYLSHIKTVHVGLIA